MAFAKSGYGWACGFRFDGGEKDKEKKEKFFFGRRLSKRADMVKIKVKRKNTVKRKGV